MARLVGLELPFEAKQALRTLPTLDSIEPVLSEVLAHVCGKPASAETFKALSKATTLDAATLGALFTGLDWLLRTCIRCSLKTKFLHEALTECRVHPPFIEPLISATERGRAQLAPAHLTQLEDDTALRGRLDLPTLDDLRWRLDVVISSSVLQVVLRPQLTMQCALSDGSTHAFHVSKQQFNDLRYTAARCLKEMEDGAPRDIEGPLPLTLRPVPRVRSSGPEPPFALLHMASMLVHAFCARCARPYTDARARLSLFVLQSKRGCRPCRSLTIVHHVL